MEDIIDIVIKIVAAILTLGGVWLLRNLQSWLAIKLGAEKTARLDKLISELVAAADQQYKELDATGKLRLAYVTGLLEQLGYEMTEIIRAKIEAEVFSLPVKKTAKKDCIS